MRKIFLHMMVSLDGYIETPDGSLDWHHVDAEFENYINDLLRSTGGMIFGRKAFELLAQYWPAVEADPSIANEAPVPAARLETARLINALPKYVLTTTLKRTGWANSHILGGDVAAEAARLKSMPGKDIALVAGAQAAISFMRAGLLDEIRLIVNPVVLGGGTPLFQAGYGRRLLALRHERRFASGAVLLVYTPGPS